MVPVLVLAIFYEVRHSFIKLRTNGILKYITDSKIEVGNQYVKNHYHGEATYRSPGARLSKFKPSVYHSLALWLQLLALEKQHYFGTYSRKSNPGAHDQQKLKLAKFFKQLLLQFILNISP